MTIDPATLAAELGAVDEVDLDPAPGPNYNVAPTTPVLTVVARHDRDVPDSDPTLRVRAMRWGLIPPWAKEAGKGPLLFNARAETATTKPSFRASARSRRALIPMDGWYEWRPGPPDERGKPTKIPYFMAPADGTRLFMAGLWSVWRSPEADPAAAPLLSTTILTTDAVGDLRGIHDRMPLIMPYGRWDEWLDPDVPAPAELYAPPSPDLVAAIDITEVSPLVNRIGNNGPELLNPV